MLQHHNDIHYDDHSMPRYLVDIEDFAEKLCIAILAPNGTQLLKLIPDLQGTDTHAEFSFDIQRKVLRCLHIDETTFPDTIKNPHLMAFRRLLEKYNMLHQQTPSLTDKMDCIASVAAHIEIITTLTMCKNMIYRYFFTWGDKSLQNILRHPEMHMRIIGFQNFILESPWSNANVGMWELCMFLVHIYYNKTQCETPFLRRSGINPSNDLCMWKTVAHHIIAKHWPNDIQPPPPDENLHEWLEKPDQIFRLAMATIATLQCMVCL